MRASLLIAGLVAAAIAGVLLWSKGSSEHPNPCGAVDSRPSQAGIPAASEATICLLNRERTERGLPALRENALLNEASLQHSQDMVQRDYFEHTTPDGVNVGDRLRALGYSRGVNASAGENIAWGIGAKSTPAKIVDIWMHSPPHRADILRPAFTEIGIGVALGAPEVGKSDQAESATYTTDFGGVPDPSLPSG